MKAEVQNSVPSPKTPPFSTLVLLTLLPLLAAVGTGIWISAQLRTDGLSDARRSPDARLEETVTQEKLLSEAFWLSMDRLRTEARAFAVLGKVAELGVPIAAAFEFSIDPKNFAAPGALRKRSGFEALRPEYERASRALSRRELKENAVAVLAARDGNLGFGFESAAQDSVVVIWLKAETALSFFDRWAKRSHGGSLRGYLMDQKGATLASSGGALADFESSVRALFVQNVLSGAQANDTSAMAYSRLGTLPWATVAQRQVPVAAAADLTSALGRAVASPLFQAGAQGLIFLLALYFAFSIWVRRLWVIAEESAALPTHPAVWTDLSRSSAPGSSPGSEAWARDWDSDLEPSLSSADHDHTV